MFLNQLIKIIFAHEHAHEHEERERDTNDHIFILGNNFDIYK